MFFLLNKPKGITSFKAIKDFARANKIKKIGHTGTLDPLASGLLLVATEDDTRLIEFIDKGYKTYIATMELGKEMSTYDIEGEEVNVSSKEVTDEEVQNALMSFVGFYDQTPPAFSAKKIDGVRAYDLARDGKAVELKPVRIEIKEIKNFKKVADKTYEFEVTVSRGTYIRSLIHDCGIKLGTYAFMTDLIRNKIGELNLVDTYKEVDVRSLITLPIIILDEITDLKNGKLVKRVAPDGTYALEWNSEIIGVGSVKDNILKSDKLLGNKLSNY